MKAQPEEATSLGISKESLDQEEGQIPVEKKTLKEQFSEILNSVKQFLAKLREKPDDPLLKKVEEQSREEVKKILDLELVDHMGEKRDILHKDIKNRAEARYYLFADSETIPYEARNEKYKGLTGENIYEKAGEYTYEAKKKPEQIQVGISPVESRDMEEFFKKYDDHKIFLEKEIKEQDEKYGVESEKNFSQRFERDFENFKAEGKKAFYSEKLGRSVLWSELSPEAAKELYAKEKPTLSNMWRQQKELIQEDMRIFGTEALKNGDLNTALRSYDKLGSLNSLLVNEEFLIKVNEEINKLQKQLEGKDPLFNAGMKIHAEAKMQSLVGYLEKMKA